MPSTFANGCASPAFIFPARCRQASRRPNGVPLARKCYVGRPAGLLAFYSMATRPAEIETHDPAEITQALNVFLAEHPQSLLLEDGEILFDLREANHTIEHAQGKTVLHVWSEQRNQVRRIVSAKRRGGVLRLKAQRFGRTEPQSLELVNDRGRRPPATRDGARDRYLRLLQRVLAREFPQSGALDLRSSMDLEHSFGPGYVRGEQVRGQRAWAMIGVGATESPAMIEGVLTLGILWLAYCRERSAGRRVVEGLRLIVPAGAAATTLARLAWMDPRIAKYALYELDETTETLVEKDVRDRGNLATRLVRAADETAVVAPGGRFAAAIPRVLALVPEQPRAVAIPLASAHSHEGLLPATGDGFEMRLRSSAELAFLRHGLEFARIRTKFQSESFNRELEVTIGSGLQETVLTDQNASAMRGLVHELFARRSVTTAVRGTTQRDVQDTRDPLFRLQPERWLESLLRADVRALDTHLAPTPVYVQVPAIAGASDRGMLDLLAATVERRLAVIEVKADEDLHFALQGLDYWIRVRDHHLAHVDPTTGLGDLQQHGYFPETRLLAEPPVLYLVAPALRIHPATETVLHHFDPRVRWTLIALDERWRTRIRPVWRKQSSPA